MYIDKGPPPSRGAGCQCWTLPRRSPCSYPARLPPRAAPLGPSAPRHRAGADPGQPRSLHTPPGYRTLCQKTQGACSRFVPFHRSTPERAAGDTAVSGAGSPVRSSRCRPLAAAAATGACPSVPTGVSVFMYRPATINRLFYKLRLFSKLRPSRPSFCARRGGRGAQAQSGAGLGRCAARCRRRRRRFRPEAAGRSRRHDDDDGAEQDLRAEAREVPAGGGRRVLHDRL